MADDRWLVVGLGNPQAQYAGTRHNVGADAVRGLAERERVELSRNKRVRSEVGEARLAGNRVVLSVPSTYMNSSGGPVQSTAKWFNAPIERIIVCHDDLDVPIGSLKLKRGGGHAGHNGLKDIDRALGSREYLRVRIGIGRPPGRMPGRDYVLRRFPPADRERVAVALTTAADAIASLIADGLEASQNRFHATD